MKNLFPVCIIFALMAGLLTGCQTHGPVVPAQDHNAPDSTTQLTRNNCYSLLYQLLSEQKDVSVLRFLKHEDTDVKDLVKRIAKDSGTGAEQLEKFAKDDPSIRLDEIDLPPGETATRDAIEASKKKQLLFHSGDEFEMALLLTQTEALNYAWHLAVVAAKTEPQPARAEMLTALAANMEKLYDEVFGLLLSHTRIAPTNSVSSSVPPPTTNTVAPAGVLMIEPSSMSIAGGRATLTIGTLQRANGVYTGEYRVKVFPYFNKNENGRLLITVPDASLTVLNQGKTVNVIGSAITTGKEGLVRHVDAIATPIDLTHGKLKLWFVTEEGRKMIFEPSYHFVAGIM